MKQQWGDLNLNSDLSTPPHPPPFCLSSLYKCRYLSPLPAPWLASYRAYSAVRRDFRRIKLLGIVGSVYSSLLFSIFNILPPQPSPFRVSSHLCAGDVWGYLQIYGFFFFPAILTSCREPGDNFLFQKLRLPFNSRYRWRGWHMVVYCVCNTGDRVCDRKTVGSCSFK